MQPSQPHRFLGLDSIRGLAATAVLLNHCYTLLPDRFQHVSLPHSLAALFDPWMLFKFTPARMLINGRAAVIIFFVLSGFVLRSSFLKAQGTRYWSYAGQRLVRLWIPYAATVLIASALLTVIGPHPVPQVNPDFTREVWQAPATWPRILGALLASGRADDLLMDLPLWSLVHEIRISLLFPLIAVLVSRRPLICLGAAVALHFACHFASPNFDSATIKDSLIQSAGYLLFFVAGFALADRPQWAQRLTQAAGPLGCIGALIVALLLFALPQSTLVSDILYGVGAMVVIGLTVNLGWLSKALQAPPVAWLGRVSFSLYLIHLVCITAIVHLVYVRLGWTPNPVLLGAVLITVPLIAAEILHRTVEAPARELSHWTQQRIVGALAPATA